MSCRPTVNDLRNYHEPRERDGKGSELDGTDHSVESGNGVNGQREATRARKQVDKTKSFEKIKQPFHVVIGGQNKSRSKRRLSCVVRGKSLGTMDRMHGSRERA